MNEPTESPPREADRLIYAGLLGLSVAGALQMMEKTDLDEFQNAAVYAFATAVPLLAVGLVTDYARRAGTHVPSWRDLIGLAGGLAAVAGLGAVFFHFGIGVGVVFMVGCLVGFVFVRSL